MVRAAPGNRRPSGWVLLVPMATRAPLLTFSLAAGILAAGTAFDLLPAAGGPGTGVHQTSGLTREERPAPAVEPQTEAAALAFTAPASLAEPEAALPVPKAAPAAAAFEQMKHVWQSVNNCGPAAVVMALSTLGVDASQEVARLALRGPDERRGMGPTPVGPWVKDSFGLRSMWRNNGTNDLMRRLLANGFAPMVTQWMQDPSVSRIAHWRTLRGYDDARRVFYVNDSMLGNNVTLPYDWFAKNWQSFSYRYMVIYRPEDEPLLRAIVGRDWSESYVRQAMYERARSEALAHDTNFAWLAYGEASYAFGVFDEAVAAFERGLSLGSATGAFGVRSSYPQALRALGRRDEADAVARKLSSLSPVPATVAAAPDPYAMFLAISRMLPRETLPTE